MLNINLDDFRKKTNPYDGISSIAREFYFLMHNCMYNLDILNAAL